MAQSVRYRERHRDQRRREFLETARRIVTTEGIDALTMQRVTDDLACATGSIYRYYRSKGTLIAAVQREALEALGASLRLGQTHLDELLAANDVDPGTAALARVLAAGRFWINAGSTFPQEIELLRRLFTHHDTVLTDDEASPVVPAALELLALGREVLDAAVAAGALSEGPNLDRAITILAGSTGVLLTDGLRRWDGDLFDGARLADELLWDLLLAWEADPRALTFVDELVTALDDERRLVPVLLTID